MQRIWFFDWDDVIETRGSKGSDGIRNAKWLREFLISRRELGEPVFVATHKCKDAHNNYELRDKVKLTKVILGDSASAEEKKEFNLDDYVRITYANDPTRAPLSTETKITPDDAETIDRIKSEGKNGLIRYTLQKYGVKIPGGDLKNIVLIDDSESNCQKAHAAGFSVIFVDHTNAYVEKAKSFAKGDPVAFELPKRKQHATEAPVSASACSCVIL